MDIARPDLAIKRRRRRIRWTAGGVGALAIVTFGLSRLKPAVPTVDHGLVWIDTVKRGPLVREVRGTGTLVPEDIRWVLARASGRVERILLQPGAPVTPDSVIAVLSNPELEREAENADAQLKVGEAEMEDLKVQLESDVLDAEAAAYSAQATYEQAALTAESNRTLYEQGIITRIEMQKQDSMVKSGQLNADAAKKRLEVTQKSQETRLAAKAAAVDVLRNQAQQRSDEVAGLRVRAGMNGVVQVVQVELGAQVASGAQVARVSDPTKLKAQVRIPETQARDIQIGQSAKVDTRNGIVPAEVARIDPAVQNGTVAVDLALQGDLPRGARPDLSVDGIVELERIDDTLYTGRPAFGQEMGTVGMFRLEDDGVYADRVAVKLGHSSVSDIQVLSGLNSGDRVILSDLSQFDAVDRIRLK